MLARPPLRLPALTHTRGSKLVPMERKSFYLAKDDGLGTAGWEKYADTSLNLGERLGLAHRRFQKIRNLVRNWSGILVPFERTRKVAHRFGLKTLCTPNCRAGIGGHRMH